MEDRFNFLAIALFVLLLLAIGDSMLGYLDGKRLVRVVQGGSQPINGVLNDPPLLASRMNTPDPTPEEVSNLLEVVTETRGLDIDFKELKGRIWRGILKASWEAEPGEYRLAVQRRGDVPVEDEAVFTVRVFADQADRRADMPTFSGRYLGLRPLWVVLIALPLSLLVLLFSFIRAGKEDIRLQAMGLGPIYKLARKKEGWEIVVGLGARHGVREGDVLDILDPKGEIRGQLRADRVGPHETYSVLDRDSDIKPGYLVGRQNAGLGNSSWTKR